MLSQAEVRNNKVNLLFNRQIVHQSTSRNKQYIQIRFFKAIVLYFDEA